MKTVPRIRWVWFFAILLWIAGLISFFKIPLQTDLFSLFPQELESLKKLKSLQKDPVFQKDLFLVFPEKGDWTPEKIMAFKSLWIQEIKNNPSFTHETTLALAHPLVARRIAALIASLPENNFRQFLTQFTESTLQEKIKRSSEQWSGIISEEEILRGSLDPLHLMPSLPSLTSTPSRKNFSTETRWLRFQTQLPTNSFEDAQKIESSIRETIQKILLKKQWSLETHPILLTGESIFQSQISSSMQRDMTVMLSFTFILVILLFLTAYRSLSPLFSIILVQSLVISAALLVAFCFFDGLNVITIGFASILIGISLDYCILVYHHFASGGTGSGTSWKILVKGIWFSALSTGGAFAILYFSSFPGLQQMAVLVATGLLTSAAFSTTLLADLFRRRPPLSIEFLNQIAHRWGSFLHRFHRPLFIVLVAIIPLTFFWYGLPSTSSLYDSNIDRLQPNHLEAYHAHSLIKSWNSIAENSILPLSSNRPLWNPETGALYDRVTERKSEYQGLAREVIRQLDLWSLRQTNLDGKSIGDQEWKDLRQEIDLLAVRDFKTLSLFMLALVLFLCWIAHRSLFSTLMNMGALIYGLVLFFLFLMILKIPLTLVSLICIPLLIGLIIDYTIHLLLGLENETGGLERTFHHLLVPILTTGLTSLIGFTAPALSSQPALLNFGWVMDLGVLSAMITVLIFLPVCFTYFKKPTKTHYSRSLYSAKFFELASHLALFLPRGFARFLARRIAELYLLFHPQNRSLIRENQKLLGPSVASQCSPWKLYSNFAASIADYFYFGVRGSWDHQMVVRNKIGYNHLSKAVQEGRGGFILTSHLSFFELGGMLLTSFGFKGIALSLPEPSSELTEWRYRFRQKWGIETIEVGSTPFSTFKILEALRRNEFVIALIDRPNAAQTTSVEFPGGSVEFASGILSIARATGSPILLGLITEAEGGYYDSIIYPPLPPSIEKDSKKAVQIGCNQIRDLLLPVLQKNPNQWYQFAALTPPPTSSENRS